MQEGYAGTFSQVHTLLTGSEIPASSVVLIYVKGNLESSHAMVYGEVEVQSDAFMNLTYMYCKHIVNAWKYVRVIGDINLFSV